MGCGGSSAAAGGDGTQSMESKGASKGEPDVQELKKLQEYIGKVPMFAKVPPMDRLNMAKSFTKIRYKADDIIVEQDSVGTEFYIVGQGELVVSVNNTAVATLAQGDYFGETGLVSNQKRNATISAEEPAMCFVLTKVKFEKLGMRIKGDTLKAKGRKTVNVQAKKANVQDQPRSTTKNQKTVDTLSKALKSNDNLKVLLGEMGRDQVRAAVDRAWKMEVEEGQPVIEQGDEVADLFFLVETGNFEVYVSTNPGMSLEEKVQSVQNEAPSGISSETAKKSENMGLTQTKDARKSARKSRKSMAPKKEGGEGTESEGGGGDGSASINPSGAAADKTLVAERGPGSSFGELALIQNAPRAATIQASIPSVVWVLDRHEFRQCLTEFAEKKAEQYVALLKNVELMKKLSDEELRAVSQECEEVMFMDNEKVITEGEEGDTFYVIMAGRCDVFVGGENVKQMGVGDFFGERAILKKEKRAATIQVPADYGGATLLVLDQDSFVDTLGAKSFNRAKSMYMKIQIEDINDDEMDENTIVAPSQLEVLGQISVSEFGFTKLVRDNDTKNTYALKTISKAAVLRVEYQDHPLREAEVLRNSRSCKFLQQMICSYRDSENLYFVLKPCIGGNVHDLYSDDAKGLKGNEAAVKFHTACAMIALNDLHTVTHAIHRDIRAENILLDQDGYAMIGGFDLAKKTVCRTYTFCGLPECLAPEVVSLQSGYGRPVDWWALGVAMFELMTGTTPFANANPMTTYKNIKAGHKQIDWPASIPAPMKSLMIGLLTSNPKERMGIKGKWERLASQDWLKDFAWDQLKSRTTTPPWKPPLKGAEDLSLFDQSQKADHHTSGVAAKVAEDWDVTFGFPAEELDKDVAAQKARGDAPPFMKLEEGESKEAAPVQNGGARPNLTPLPELANGTSADDTDPPALSEHVRQVQAADPNSLPLNSPKPSPRVETGVICCCSPNK